MDDTVNKCFTDYTDGINERSVAAVGYALLTDSRAEQDRKQTVYMAACAFGNWELAADEEREEEARAARLRWR